MPTYGKLSSHVKDRAYLTLDLGHTLSHFNDPLSLGLHYILGLLDHSRAYGICKLSLLHTCGHRSNCCRIHKNTSFRYIGLQQSCKSHYDWTSLITLLSSSIPETVSETSSDAAFALLSI